MTPFIENSTSRKPQKKKNKVYCNNTKQICGHVGTLVVWGELSAIKHDGI